MTVSRLFSSWVCVAFNILAVQALVFDILRNSSHDVCAILRCQVRVDDRDVHDIGHVISLAISERDSNQNSRKPLASLSFFDADIPTLGDEPQHVYATGKLLSKEGELTVHLKGALTRCLTGVFMCELKYLNSKGEGKVVTAEKQLHAVVKQSETSHHVSDRLNNLKTVIVDEVAKLSEQAENGTASIVSAVTSMNERLIRLEGMMEGNLLVRLDSLDLKLNKLEVLLSNNVDVTLRSLTEAIANSTDDIKGYVNSRVLKSERQMSTIEASIAERVASTESWMNESFRSSLESHMGCEYLEANVSSMFHQVQDYISTFKTDIMRRLSPVDKDVSSSSELLSTRLVMESLVRIVHNVSIFDSRLVKLKSDFDREMKTVHLNISSLNDNMANRHFRFTREVKQNISGLESLLADKFKELDSQKRSLSSLGKELGGKLLNIEINLKDINVVVRSIKYIFGL